MSYNPCKEVVPTNKLDGLIMHIIERHPNENGAHWGDYYRLIENVLSRDEDVANCAVDFDGQKVYVALTGDTYDIDDLEAIDTRLRGIIGKVACFDFFGSSSR